MEADQVRINNHSLIVCCVLPRLVYRNECVAFLKADCHFKKRFFVKKNLYRCCFLRTKDPVVCADNIHLKLTMHTDKHTIAYCQKVPVVLLLFSSIID